MNIRTTVTKYPMRNETQKVLVYPNIIEVE